MVAVDALLEKAAASILTAKPFTIAMPTASSSLMLASSMLSGLRFSTLPILRGTSTSTSASPESDGIAASCDPGGGGLNLEAGDVHDPGVGGDPRGAGAQQRALQDERLDESGTAVLASPSCGKSG